MHSSRMHMSAAVAMSIPACTGQGGVCVSQHALGRGLFAWGVSPEGVLFYLEGSAQGGLHRGCLPRGGGLPRGMSAWGFCLGGVCMPACTGADTPPVNRMTGVTRLHSSRMRTTCSIDHVSPSMLCARGVYLHLAGGVCLGGVLPRGCTWSQGGVYLVCQGGDLVQGGVYLVPGGLPGPGGCTWSGTPPL